MRVFPIVLYFILASTSYAGAQTYKDSLDFVGNYFESLRLLAIDNSDLAAGHLQHCTSQLPDESSSYYMLGKIAESKKDLSTALTNYKRANKLSADNFWYVEALARVYLQLGEQKKAYSIYENLLDRDENRYNEFLILSYARLLEGNSDYLKSARYYQQYCDLNKYNDYGLKIVKLYYNAQKLDQALQKTEQLITEDTNNYDLWVLKAELLIGQKLATDSAAYFAQLIDRFPNIPDAQYVYAEYLYQRGSYAELVSWLVKVFRDKDAEPQKKVELFKQLLNDKAIQITPVQLLDLLNSLTLAHPRVFDINYLAGSFYYDMAKYNLAASSFSIARHLDPNNYRVWELELNCLVSIRRFDRAIQVSDSAQMLYPTRPELYLMKGIALSGQARHADALAQYSLGQELIVDNPALEASFYSATADALYANKQYPEAFAKYDAVLALLPQHVGTLNNYSYYLAQQNQQLDKALLMAEQVATLAPNIPNFMDTHAWVLFKLKRYADARTVIEQAIQLNPDASAVVYEHYGDILLALQANEQAKAAYQKALDQDKSNQALLDKIHKIK